MCVCEERKCSVCHFQERSVDGNNWYYCTLFPTVVKVFEKEEQNQFSLKFWKVDAWERGGEMREGWRCDSLQQRGRNISSKPTDKTIESLNTLSGWVHAWKLKHFL